MASEIYYKNKGKVQKVGTSTKSPLVMVNGVVHTYDSGDLSEPYINEWGWQCCTTDLEKEIYRWMYRCMVEGLDVPTRTVNVDFEGEVTFVVDGKISGTKEITDDIIRRNGDVGKAIVDMIQADPDTTYMRIPLAQFHIDNETLVYNIVKRIIADNPLIMFPAWPMMPDAVTIVNDEMGQCRYFYSVAPTKDKRAQAVDICIEQIEKIKQKIAELYGIQPGDVLTVDQKAKVLKVIHDHLVLLGNLEDGLMLAWWQTTPYAVYDNRYQGTCTSYTMAFLAAVRLYGIEAVNMTGIAYIDTDDTHGDYEIIGGHSWVAVRLSDEAYGTYPKDPAKWSCIDVYWDEPLHAIELGFVPKHNNVIWAYFLDMSTINILSEGEENHQQSYRVIDADRGYGKLPMDGIPTLSMPYMGNNIYIWEDQQ